MNGNYKHFCNRSLTLILECHLHYFCSLQNVLSKKILSFQTVSFNPGEIQYHTGIASILAQIPIICMFGTYKGIEDLTTPHMSFLYLINGVCFHFQTISGIAIMEAISPVTHSVVNTLKRALLIWVSVIIFKNPVTLYSGLGTTIVFLGVIMYNKARWSWFVMSKMK